MAALQPLPPLAENMAEQWMLRPDIAFLNHGSFGAVSRKVFEIQNQWRKRIEAEPVEFLGRENDALVAEVKRHVGDWLHMRPQDFGLMTNATEGVNSYLRSLSLKPGDELLTTNHVYNAVRQTMRYLASISGAVYREIAIPTPITSDEQIVTAIAANLNASTRLLVIDHVTSPTALIFPLKTILAVCRDRLVDVLVDGAHAPAMLELDIESLQPAAYAGNLHKWACAPKGSAFLWVRPDRQTQVHPCTVSHYWNEGFAREFDWQGTRDVSAWLTIPNALQYMNAIGWPKIREHNHRLCMWAQSMLCQRWNVQPIAPMDGSMTGSMATIALPGRLAKLPPEAGFALHKALYHGDQIEVPLMRWQDELHVRISVQVYNKPQDYHRLADAILRRQREIGA